MHMADALISPVAGGAMWAVTIGTAAYSVRKVRSGLDEKKIPMMGVMGAFIFAVQMINFSIPGTGSSGHLGGGLILAALLGPYAGFLTMMSVLLIQSLLFADGGLLAFGCNVFNLGFMMCFVAYPLIYKNIVGKSSSNKRILAASVTAAILGLQMGAFGVVLETLLSGRTQLPFGTFVLFMQPIHLAIGLVEGLVTAAVIAYISKTRPELLESAASGTPIGKVPVKKVIIGFAVVIAVIAGIFSWFASSDPDGLEWSLFKTTGEYELDTSSSIHDVMSGIQDKTAILPDYSFKTDEAVSGGEAVADEDTSWLSVNAGTSVSGITGGVMTLVLAICIGLAIGFFKKMKKRAAV